MKMKRKTKIRPYEGKGEIKININANQEQSEMILKEIDPSTLADSEGRYDIDISDVKTIWLNGMPYTQEEFEKLVDEIVDKTNIKVRQFNPAFKHHIVIDGKIIYMPRSIGQSQDKGK